MKDQALQNRNPWVLPEWIESDLRKRIPGLPMRNPITDEAFDMLWQMIDDATKEFRQAAVRNELDVYATLSQAEDLSLECFKRFGMNDADFELLAFEMVESCAYAGFFGLYIDRWLLEEAIISRKA